MGRGETSNEASMDGMKWFDEVLDLIVTWRHRYLVELSLSVVFLLTVHFVVYPIMLKRYATLRSDAVKTLSSPLGTTTNTITTGSITTNGPNSGVTIGVPPPPTQTSKTK